MSQCSLEWLAKYLPRTFPADLRGVPCYMLSADQVPPGDLFPHSFLGFTAGTLSERLQATLGALGMWQGAGFGCVVAPEVRQWSRDWQIHLVIHELAHYLIAKFLRDHGGIDQQEVSQGLLVSAESWNQTAHDLESAGWLRSLGAVPPWLSCGDHGSQFVRVALHVGARVESTGFLFDERRSQIAGETYGLSHPGAYRDALRQELWLNRWDTIAELLSRPEPPEFRRLFLADVLRWSNTVSPPPTSDLRKGGHQAP